jgi:tetratricopeptide (TPR) repeat protein
MLKVKPQWAIWGLAAPLLISAAAPAQAQHLTTVQECADSKISAEQRIEACTSLIASDRFRGKTLGVIYELRGRAYLDRSDLTRAMRDFNRAIALTPELAPAYRARGELYLRDGHALSAIADFDRSLRIEPIPQTYLLRAQAKAQNGDAEGALADYHQVLQSEPANVPALIGEAGIWRDRGDLDKALALYDHALAADQARSEIYQLRAQAYLAKGDREHAIDDISHALSLNRTADLLQLRAKLRVDTGDLAGALQDANAALELDPHNKPAMMLRNDVLARSKGEPAATKQVAGTEQHEPAVNPERKPTTQETISRESEKVAPASPQRSSTTPARRGGIPSPQTGAQQKVDRRIEREWRRVWPHPRQLWRGAERRHLKTARYPLHRYPVSPPAIIIYYPAERVLAVRGLLLWHACGCGCPCR